MPGAIQFLYTLQATRSGMLADGPSSKEQAVMAQHLAYLRELTKPGGVLMAGRTLNTDASAFGMVILRVDSESEARAIMQGDPAVVQGVMRAELYPYRVALMANTACSENPVDERQDADTCSIGVHDMGTRMSGRKRLSWPILGVVWTNLVLPD
jgi:uncharacterized protein YciI